MKCPFDCIFYPDSDILCGDCRAPYREECFLNQKSLKRTKQTEDTPTLPGLRAQ